MNGSPERFEIDRADVSGASGLAIRGEIDLSVSVAFERAVDAAIRESVGTFVLDLCNVEFVDSSALSVVLRARALLAREDRILAIVCPPGSVRRMLEVVGIIDLLVLYRSRDELAAELVPID